MPINPKKTIDHSSGIDFSVHLLDGGYITPNINQLDSSGQASPRGRDYISIRRTTGLAQLERLRYTLSPNGAQRDFETIHPMIEIFPALELSQSIEHNAGRSVALHLIIGRSHTPYTIHHTPSQKQRSVPHEVFDSFDAPRRNIQQCWISTFDIPKSKKHGITRAFLKNL